MWTSALHTCDDATGRACRGCPVGSSALLQSPPLPSPSPGGDNPRQEPGRVGREGKEEGSPGCSHSSPSKKLSILIKIYSLKSCAINTDRCIERAYLTNLRDNDRNKLNTKYLLLYLHVSSFSFLYPWESSKHCFHTWRWLRLIFLKQDELLDRDISHI